jgi:hypothetical protein
MSNPIPRDFHGKPITSTDWGLQCEKTITFAGATGNDPGDKDGTSAATTLFKVTGTVLLRILAKCLVNLVGAAGGGTLEVGTALSTAGLIAQTSAEAIYANEIWHDATPDSSIEATTVLAQKIVSQDVIQTVATQDVNSGKIKYTAIWYPLSGDGKVEPA